MYLLQMTPKFILTLIILLIYIKLSGKSQMAPVSQLDQVGNMVIGAIVGGSLLSPNVSILESIGIVFIWAGLLISIRFIKSKSLKIRTIIDGCNIQLIKDGKLLSQNFKKAKLSIRDFETLVNVQGVYNINQLKHAWYELNGALTIIKKGDEDIATLLIENGCINEEGLKEISKDQAWLKQQLKKQNYSNIEDIFCAEWHGEKLWVYPKDEPTS